MSNVPRYGLLKPNRLGYCNMLRIYCGRNVFIARNKNKVQRVIIVDSRQAGYLGIVLGVCLVALNILFR